MGMTAEPERVVVEPKRCWRRDCDQPVFMHYGTCEQHWEQGLDDYDERGEEECE